MEKNYSIFHQCFILEPLGNGCETSLKELSSHWKEFFSDTKSIMNFASTQNKNGAFLSLTELLKKQKKSSTTTTTTTTTTTDNKAVIDKKMAVDNGEKVNEKVIELEEEAHDELLANFIKECFELFWLLKLSVPSIIVSFDKTIKSHFKTHNLKLHKR